MFKVTFASDRKDNNEDDTNKDQKDEAVDQVLVQLPIFDVFLAALANVVSNFVVLISIVPFALSNSLHAHCAH